MQGDNNHQYNSRSDVQQGMHVCKTVRGIGGVPGMEEATGKG